MVAQPSSNSPSVEAMLVGLPRRRLKFEEYEQLVLSGSFEDERVELLYGEVVEMSPQSTEHVWLVKEIGKQLTIGLVGRAEVQAQSTMRAAANSAPEPDILVYPSSEDHPRRWPTRFVLCVEVADSSHGRDLGPKARLYALSDVTEYWVFDLVKRSVRRHVQPADGEYRVVETLLAGRSERLSVPGYADVSLDIDALFDKV